MARSLEGHFHQVTMKFRKPNTRLEHLEVNTSIPLQDKLESPHFTRTVGFFIPEQCSKQEPQAEKGGHSLLIAFHGSTEDAKIFRNRTTANSYDILACENGYVVAYPDGYKGNWNDSRKSAKYATKTDRVDDIQFTLAIIEYAFLHFQTLKKRTFVVGQGNGGQFVYRLCLQLGSEFLAGAAVHSMTLPTSGNMGYEVLDVTPVPVCIINGELDPIVPINGGEVALAPATKHRKAIGSRGMHIGSTETAHFLVDRFQRAGYAPTLRQETVIRKNESAANVSQWVDNEQGRVLVKLVALLGEGHAISTGTGKLRTSLLGPRRGLVNTPREVMEFFQQATTGI